jgi:hypothetical protein
VSGRRRALEALANHEPYRKHVRNGAPPHRTALAMAFKLVEAAQKNWRRLDGNNQLPKLILGVKFADGVEVVAKQVSRHPITVAA